MSAYPIAYRWERLDGTLGGRNIMSHQDYALVLIASMTAPDPAGDRSITPLILEMSDGTTRRITATRPAGAA